MLTGLRPRLLYYPAGARALAIGLQHMLPRKCHHHMPCTARLQIHVLDSRYPCAREQCERQNNLSDTLTHNGRDSMFNFSQQQQVTWIEKTLKHCQSFVVLSRNGHVKATLRSPPLTVEGCTFKGLRSQGQPCAASSTAAAGTSPFRYFCTVVLY